MQYMKHRNFPRLIDKTIDMEEFIKKIHSNDKEQLHVIFSNEKRIIVEAPAGCGKTRTMTSKIMYLISKNLVPNPKKILGLTFSVNAAYKMKKEIRTTSLDVLGKSINDRVVITNYHGLCRQILSKYGYLIDPKLLDINNLIGFNEDKVEDLVNLFNLKYEHAEFISNIPKFIREVNSKVFDYMDEYLRLCKEFILPHRYIPFNAIIMFTLKLFNEYAKLREFYQKLYPYIIVDEFQDTNILGYELLKLLISKSTSLLIMGDPLQQIYGFIGAIPNIMEIAKKEFKMKKISFNRNYRFKNNKKLLILDNTIRENAKYNHKTKKILQIDLIYAKEPEEEYYKVVRVIKKIFEKDPYCKVALLIRQRNKNSDLLLDILEENKLPYFYALFSEENSDYIKFHSEALKKMKEIHKFTKNTLKIYLEKCYNDINIRDIKIKESLMRLLEAFAFKGLFEEFHYLSSEEKKEILRDALENRSLRYGLEFLNEKLIVVTVHSAKGLEWDYVILPDMEQYSFPSFQGLCKYCKNHSSCEKYYGKSSKFYEELSVFYVACTRARKDLYFSASKKRINMDERRRKVNISCFLNFFNFTAK